MKPYSPYDSSAAYAVVERHPTYIVIRDLGPWDKHPTVTNDVESVVYRLIEEGELQFGQRLFYFASDDAFDEIQIHGGKFFAFRPGKRP